MEKQRQEAAKTGSRRRPDEPTTEDASTKQERIRVLAYQIYETRCSSGMLGDPVSDWLEAERQLADEKAAKSRRSANRNRSPAATRSP